MINLQYVLLQLIVFRVHMCICVYVIIWAVILLSHGTCNPAINTDYEYSLITQWWAFPFFRILTELPIN